MKDEAPSKRGAPWGLDALAHPLGAAAFLDEVWPTELFIGEGPTSRFDALFKINELGSIEALLGAVTDHVSVWPPHESNGESAQLVPPTEALRLYEEGWTVYLNRVERFVPALLLLIRPLEIELGLHVGDVATEVFASKATAGARPHCDFDFGFNIQLRGTKTWRLAPNANFKNPHASVIIADPFEPEVASYSKGVLPRTMPTDGQRLVVTKPGSVVFLPRGYWHMTVAHEPSLALTFACKGATWSDLVRRELELRLRQLEPWREFPERWVGAAGVTRADKETKLAALLADLPEIIKGLTAHELIDKWTAPRVALYAVSDKTRPELLPDPADEHGVIVGIGQGEGKRRLLRISPEHVRVVEALVTTTSPFTASDAAAILGVPLDEMQAMIDSLVGEEILAPLRSL